MKARAKIEMRKTCSKIDALEVIEIMRSSMVDTFDNELGLLDVTIEQSQLNATSGNSKSAQIKDFVGILQTVSEKKKSLMFSFDDIKEIYEVFYNLIIQFYVTLTYFYYLFFFNTVIIEV